LQEVVAVVVLLLEAIHTQVVVAELVDSERLQRREFPMELII
jgi:hypothetical protein